MDANKIKKINIKLKGIRPSIFDIYFKANSNGIFKFKDSGYVDVTICDGGLDLDILLIYDSTKPDCMIQPSQITVDLKKVRLYFHQVKHTHLLRFYSAGLSKFFRKEIIFQIKNHINTTTAFIN